VKTGTENVPLTIELARRPLLNLPLAGAISAALPYTLGIALT
jgi:hypothetical protein